MLVIIRSGGSLWKECMKNNIGKSIIILSLIFSSICTAKSERVWIYFKDKGDITEYDFELESNKNLSPKSIERRANKNKPISYDFTDLPIESSYIKELQQNGVKIKNRSKWFNAVSVLKSSIDITQLKQLPFVKKIETVRSFNFEMNPVIEEINNYKLTNSDYGASFNQNEMLGIPTVHEKGYTSNGIRIAVFDTGFKTTHQALQSLNVIASRDFIDGDDDVTGYPGETHGAQVLGVIAGYSNGNLIGPAYNAEYILAKTDDYYEETHMDEDNWVAAAEWADSLGADIITSSVGYNIFDPGEGDYTYEDMDGNTTLVTKAADLAVKKGIAVFSTAGNEGNNSWHYIIAPADGDSVIAVGSVNSSGVINSYSSRGPTFDGRIKPDLVAQGSAVHTVSFSNDINYTLVSGTSFSTPLVAGAGALVLSAMPILLPMQLYEKLITSASHASNPDTVVGYGIPDIAAILVNNTSAQDSPIRISPNPFHDFVKIELINTSPNTIAIYNYLGQKIKEFKKNDLSFTWYGESDENKLIASGVYFVVLKQNNSQYVDKIVYIK